MGAVGLARAVLAGALLFAAPWSVGEVAVPPLRARVTDLTATLSDPQRAGLEDKLAALERAKGSQVAILLVPTVQPESIEQYAIRVFDRWQLGRKGVDDGVLMLVAKNDRRMRIEVGRGLEGAIPDAYAKRIIDEEMTPRFRQGDFYGGLAAGADRVIKLVQGEPMPPPQKTAASSRGAPAQLFFIAFIVVVVLANVFRAVLGRALGAAFVGVAGGVLAYLVLGLLPVAVVLGIFAAMYALLGGLGSGRHSGWTSGGGWSSGGGFGGGGGFGSGGGGFSGGGGSSGGGGASGSW